MDSLKIVLDERYSDLVSKVDEYGYYSDVTPMCGDENCTSELVHLISDWLDNATGLKDIQKALDLKDAAFENLIGAIYVADAVEFSKEVADD